MSIQRQCDRVFIDTPNLITINCESVVLSNMKAFGRSCIFLSVLCCMLQWAASAGEIQYSGRTGFYSPATFHPFFPDTGGSVYIGTFNPNFNPSFYKYAYGSDEVGNMRTPNLSKAISDGNFRPIGSTPLTGRTFEGVAVADQWFGEKIWMFGFNSPDPDLANEFFLVSSTDSSWTVPGPGESTQLLGINANQFVFGSVLLGGVYEFQGLPVPEPTSFITLIAGMITLLVLLKGRTV